MADITVLKHVSDSMNSMFGGRYLATDKFSELLKKLRMALEDDLVNIDFCEGVFTSSVRTDATHGDYVEIVLTSGERSEKLFLHFK